MLVLIGLLAMPQLVAAWRHDPSDPASQAYYTVSLENRITYGVFYIGLIAFLALMVHDVHGMLGSARALGG
jgi:hypothetical protein